MLEGRHIEIRGTVQGVGMRPWVYRVARGLGVSGSVLNDAAGVVIEAFAEPRALDAFLQTLRSEPPPAARIQSLQVRPIPPRQEPEFVIAHSAPSAERRVSIPADLALCIDCERELLDPRDRRFAYPFINCTNCGPRFTIAQDVPYDRAATTMKSFPLCADCRREYEDPLDRRFHAQPVACPKCGPQLVACDARGRRPLGDPLAAAGEVLRAGRIVAVKGLGGYHLACDATSPEAVHLLRNRKHREERAFAVMVRNLHDAHRVAHLDAAEEALLAGVERPIVLVRRREDSGLADEIAPHNPTVGVMLAYTPLHHLLLLEMGRPLVMTSANASDEPIAYQDDDALARLAGIADLFLVHDRGIETRCDDSVARVIAGAPTVLRRSRGYTPRPIQLPRRVQRPVLAVGADLKNAICVASGDVAVLGPHVGDLGSVPTWRSLHECVDKLLRFLRVQPEVVACDLHPDSIAAGFARELGLPLVRVQHHHAHVASAMAEQGLTGEVFGVAFDGTGYGPDGTLWGGELLLSTPHSSQRIATLQPIALPGGEKAIRDVWRIALSAADAAYGGEAPLDWFPLFRDVPEAEVRLARDLVRKGVNAPLARGVGRWFDAAGALVLQRPRATYEGQVALEWNLAAGEARGTVYSYRIDYAEEPWVLDLRPMLRDVCDDAAEGVPAHVIAASFHDTLVAATAELVHAAEGRYGARPVVLTGGCFANARLAESLVAALPDLDVRLHREVPPGDGGIALGQAYAAAHAE